MDTLKADSEDWRPQEIREHYTNNIVNRYSFLRAEQDVMKKALQSSDARFVVFNELNILVNPERNEPQWLSFSDVTPFVNAETSIVRPQRQDDPPSIVSSRLVGENVLSAAWTFDPDIRLIFLGFEESKIINTSIDTGNDKVSKSKTNDGGIDEIVKRADKNGSDSNSIDNSSTAKFIADSTVTSTARTTTGSTGQSIAASSSGRPYWALDVTVDEGDSDTVKKQKQQILAKITEKGDCAFQDHRMSRLTNSKYAGMLSMADAMVHWHTYNRFCPNCGSKTALIWSGGKRVCFGERENNTLVCRSSKRVLNFQYPRTDQVVIMGIMSADRQSLLLGLNKRVHARNMYSCLAGFVEPGESIEDAVRREVWEESGVTVGKVVYHSSQPWPYPSNLVIGAIGIAAPNCEIELGNDPELSAARFFTRDEVRSILEDRADFDPTSIEQGIPAINFPQPQAIARSIIETFAYERTLPHL